MALIHSLSRLLQFPLHQSSNLSVSHILYLSSPPRPSSTLFALQKTETLVYAPLIAVKFSRRTKCFRSATEENRLSESETLTAEGDDVRVDDNEDLVVNLQHQTTKTAISNGDNGDNGSGTLSVTTSSFSSDSSSLGIREPVYEVCFRRN